MAKELYLFRESPDAQIFRTGQFSAIFPSALRINRSQHAVMMTGPRNTSVQSRLSIGCFILVECLDIVCEWLVCLSVSCFDKGKFYGNCVHFLFYSFIYLGSVLPFQNSPILFLIWFEKKKVIF